MALQECDNGWVWEACSWRYWRNACDFEYQESWVTGPCGWVYWDAWTRSEFFVTCEDYANEWSTCSGERDIVSCANEWFWEDCSAKYYRVACDDEEI